MLQSDNSIFIDGRIYSLRSLKEFFEAEIYPPIKESAAQGVAACSSYSVGSIATVLGAFYKRFPLIVLDNARKKFFRQTLLDLGFSLVNVEFNDSFSATVEVDPALVPQQLIDPGIYIFTSGTVGKPKLYRHGWGSFQSQGVDDSRNLRWLMTYSPGTFAWFQVITRWMFVKGESLVIPGDTDVGNIVKEATTFCVNATSSTPSFWRYLMLKCSREELQKLALSQITLGGEPVDQSILENLKELYPDANITHIYASTEVGVAIVVSDGKSGFPVEWLDQIGGKRLRIEDGILWVQSSRAAADIEGWYCTGDLAVVEKGRVVIVGREATDNFIIGGRKVHSWLIRDVIRRHALVSDCSISLRRAPIIGGIVSTEIVVAPEGKGLPNADIERELVKHCSEAGLEDFMIPRFWNFVTDLNLGTNFKARFSSGGIAPENADHSDVADEE